MAEEIVNAEATICIANALALGEAARQRRLIAHEMTLELAAEKIEELVRMHGAERNIGASDHLDAADVPPVPGHAVEQRVATPAK